MTDAGAVNRSPVPPGLGGAAHQLVITATQDLRDAAVSCTCLRAAGPDPIGVRRRWGGEAWAAWLASSRGTEWRHDRPDRRRLAGAELGSSRWPRRIEIPCRPTALLPDRPGYHPDRQLFGQATPGPAPHPTTPAAPVPALLPLARAGS